MPNLWLIGMMGAGKSAVAVAVAPRLGMEAVDTDAQVAARLGCSIAELWGRRGERAFRDMEAARIADLASRDGLVVATGGGAVMRPDSVEEMRASGIVAWLKASPAELAARVGAEEGRPLLAGEQAEPRLAELLDERSQAYARAAHLSIETEGRLIEAVADELVESWNAS